LKRGTGATAREAGDLEQIHNPCPQGVQSLPRSECWSPSTLTVGISSLDKVLEITDLSAWNVDSRSLIADRFEACNVEPRRNISAHNSDGVLASA